jgi:hypothetical protein
MPKNLAPFKRGRENGENVKGKGERRTTKRKTEILMFKKRISKLAGKMGAWGVPYLNISLSQERKHFHFCKGGRGHCVWTTL